MRGRRPCEYEGHPERVGSHSQSAVGSLPRLAGWKVRVGEDAELNMMGIRVY